MYTATTPKHTFTLPIDVSECKTIRIIYKQGNGCGKAVKLIKEYKDGAAAPGMSVDENIIVIKLTQEETLFFKEGAVSVQVRAVTNNGDVVDSQKFNASVINALDNDILEV